MLQDGLVEKTLGVCIEVRPQGFIRQRVLDTGEEGYAMLQDVLVEKTLGVLHFIVIIITILTI
jgi:hypothetical protein